MRRRVWPDLSKAQSYGRGDLDSDGDNDYNDFKLFKSDYTLAHGAGSFEAMLVSVPEPNTALFDCCGRHRQCGGPKASLSATSYIRSFNTSFVLLIHLLIF